jgi:hypothetical protein
MRRADEASEAARLLAQARWTPEARLKAAVDTVVTRSADLDASQRAALGAAITAPGGESRDQD